MEETVLMVFELHKCMIFKGRHISLYSMSYNTPLTVIYLCEYMKSLHPGVTIHGIIYKHHS